MSDANTTLLQARLLEWAVKEFGDIAKLPDERALRLLEEATEAAHAMGVSRQQADATIERCYSRVPGDPAKELGQVGVCLLLAAFVCNYSANTLWEAEAERLFNLPDGYFRERHAAKVAAGIAREATRDE